MLLLRRQALESLTCHGCCPRPRQHRLLLPRLRACRQTYPQHPRPHAGATTYGNGTFPQLRTRLCPHPRRLPRAWTPCGCTLPTRTCSAPTRLTWWREHLLRPLYQRRPGSQGRGILAGRTTHSPLHYVHSAAPRAMPPSGPGAGSHQRPRPGQGALTTLLTRQQHCINHKHL